VNKNDNFWHQLKKPVIGLSPMDGVTDQPYRHIHKKYGNPDVIYTEFTNVEGICHGATRLLKDFLYDETQRPIVAQIYGKTPEYFRQVSILLCQLGFDGIDINMGCPAKSVEHAGSGAALIKTPKLAQKIILATKQGVQDYLNGQRAKNCSEITDEIAIEIEKREELLPKKYQQRKNIPVSVKTRIGYSTPIVEDWIPIILETKPTLIALHGRTLKQQYSGKANWDEIKKAAELCHKNDVLILGNGDISDLDDAHNKINQFDVDGILIGRASLGNPLFFTKDGAGTDNAKPSKSIFEIALEHSYLFEKTYSSDPRYNFLPMRKHLGWYVKSFPGARDARVELFKTNNPKEVEVVLKKYKLI
jgi:tRNA-dihydrouridine synthase B